MKTMPAGEFKTHCLRVMEEVRQRREPVLITKKGVAVAKLVPVDAPAKGVFGCLEGGEITPVIAALATHFPDDFAGDPADCLIAASARADGLSLATAAERIHASRLVRTVW